MGYQTDKQIAEQISTEIDAEILKSTINLGIANENPYEILCVDEWLKEKTELKAYGINVVNEIESMLLKEIFLSIKHKK